MRRLNSSPLRFARFGGAFLLLLFFAALTPAQSSSGRVGTPEQKAASRFELLRKSPPQLLAFLLKMPKGGDLHNHLSGAIYAESFVQWAADKGLCVNQTTLVLSSPPCDQSKSQGLASAALTDTVLYRRMIDAWSMRNLQFSGQNGHDQFFDTFVKFGAVTWGQTGPMLAEAVSRAAKGHVLYLELMLTTDDGKASQIGQPITWNGDFEGTLNKLKSNGIEGAINTGNENLRKAEAQRDQILKCGTSQADAGCNVTVRYVWQVSRGSALGLVFAQMVTGFTLANDPNSKVVALNLVQPEDWLSSRQNFTVQMQMLNFLRPLYPRAHITLHAGELAPGMVPPDALTFHIRESVKTGHAERIGHGVDIMNEDDPYALLQELAQRNVMIEICLTSNDGILGITKERHPLATYIQYGVPVALATDDEGVSRSDMSREYLKAAEEQGLDYLQLKTMARTSLQYSFLPGGSLWADAKKFTPASQCSADIPTRNEISSGCKQYLASNEKARLQWKLEEDFKAFERQF